MKILLINSVCGFGSTGGICTDTAEMLAIKGHECRIAYGRGTAPKKYEKISYKVCSNLSVKINVLMARIFGNEGFNAKHSTKKFIRWIKDYNPDVIHLHNLHGYYLNVEILFKFLKSEFKGKVVWTLHDCWAFTGHCAHYVYVKCNQWQCLCTKCSRKKEYPKCLIFSNVKRNYLRKKRAITGVKNLTITTPSNWLAEDVKKSFLSDYEIKVINNGIDLSIFRPIESDFREKYNIQDKYLLLGVASVWTKMKGLDVFIELSKRLDKNKFQIILVGTNDSIDKILPKEIISIHRTQRQKELAEIYSSVDLFINPTREENYPTVNMEAIACGTPVLTFKTGGSPEIVSEKTGSIVDCGDIDGLIKKILYIEKERPYVTENCIKHAKTFDKNKCFTEYLKAYEK